MGDTPFSGNGTIGRLHTQVAPTPASGWMGSVVAVGVVVVEGASHSARVVDPAVVVRQTLTPSVLPVRS